MGVCRVQRFSTSLLLDPFCQEPHSGLAFLGTYFGNAALDLYRLYSHSAWHTESTQEIGIQSVPCPLAEGMSSGSPLPLVVAGLHSG